MKLIISIILATLFGMFIVQTIAWTSGNENYYRREIKEYLSPMEAKEVAWKFNPSKKYYYYSIVVETVTPSSFPLSFDHKFDTLSHKLNSKSYR